MRYIHRVPQEPILALPELPWLTTRSPETMRSGMTEELVAMQVEREPLEEPSNVKDPVTPPFEHLHAVVEAFHKPARLPPLEVVGDLIYPPLERPQKALELSQPAGPHPLTPGPHRTLGPHLRIVTLEHLGQIFPQV